ncbi:hypothetical protein ENTCAN_06489 [Enterobacter cancerogenus ATCC 35316]|nr:hypothetical protein ENTCAN_06489 [Enterobacter cancerogenus ATCC 35316]
MHLLYSLCSVSTAVNHLKTLDEYCPLRVLDIPFFAQPDNLPHRSAPPGRFNIKLVNE